MQIAIKVVDVIIPSVRNNNRNFMWYMDLFIRTFNYQKNRIFRVFSYFLFLMQKFKYFYLETSSLNFHAKIQLIFL